MSLKDIMPQWGGYPGAPTQSEEKGRGEGRRIMGGNEQEGAVSGIQIE